MFNQLKPPVTFNIFSMLSVTFNILMDIIFMGSHHLNRNDSILSDISEEAIHVVFINMHIIMCKIYTVFTT